MGSVLLTILGALIVSLALYDFAKTTFLPSGQGPVTAIINHQIFSGLFYLAGKDGRKPILRYAGMWIILGIFSYWIFSLWLGMALIFCSDAYSVVNSQNMMPADVYEKIYYTGFTLSTLGVGDFVAGRDIWRLLTAFTAFLGLFIITLSITYLVPVISDAGQKQVLGRFLMSLGGTPEQIVLNSYTGKDFTGISSQLSGLSSMIFTYTQNLLTYPVLHHIHNHDPRENIILRMAALDEAVNIFLFHIPEDKRPEFQSLYILRNALTSYLHITTYLKIETDSPLPPKLKMIEEETGLRLINKSEKEMKEIYQRLSNRRKLWYANLLSDGWQWNDMTETKITDKLDMPLHKLKYHA
ncbi:MAG: ion channel [Cyclobacteriaceae bacterium]